LPALLLAFAKRHCHIYAEISRIEDDLIDFLKTREFDGNVRELEHAVERMLFLKTEGDSLCLADWLQQCGETLPTEEENDPLSEAAQRLWTAIFQCGVPYNEAFRRLERRVLETALLRQGQTRREIACRLQTSERTLYHKLRTHHLTRSC